uniref:alpha/beta hydrolase n=1 Tax=Aquiflexum sp. TaxID=1872584 RepID=UPI0035933D70
MNKYSFLLIITIFYTASQSHAQNYTFDSVEPTTDTREIKRGNGQLYNLIITLPLDYQKEKEYKILYYLDAWWLKDLVSGCYRILSLSNKTKSNNMEDVILVGISSVGDEQAWNRQRNMDFTPSKYNLNYKINFGKIPLDEATTGGAEEFLQFFKQQIIPSIESDYKVDSASRGLLGHSLGGLLGFYSYLNNSDLFSNYILLAPSVWWNDSEIFRDKASIVSKRESKMFTAMGTAEIKMMKEPMGILVEKINSEKNGKLKMTYRQYENADHHSVLP